MVSKYRFLLLACDERPPTSRRCLEGATIDFNNYLQYIIAKTVWQQAKEKAVERAKQVVHRPQTLTSPLSMFFHVFPNHGPHTKRASILALRNLRRRPSTRRARRRTSQTLPAGYR